MPPPNITTTIGMVNSFAVSVGQFTLGQWAKIAGLSVKFDPIEYRTGTTNQLALAGGMAKYERIKLTRAVTGKAGSRGGGTVQSWLETYTKAPAPATGIIRLFGPGSSSAALMTWTLRGVVPMSWNVQELDASASKVALETLEIGHTGFLADEIRRGA